MRKESAAIAAIFLFCFSAAAMAARGDVNLVESDAGKVLHLAPGETITVKLVSNPSTGYTWKLATKPDPKVISLVSNRQENPAQTDPPMVGVPGWAIWVFKTVGSGSAKVQLSYVRSWDPKDHPSFYNFTVFVN